MTYRHYLVNEGPISTLAQKYAGPKGPTQTKKRENAKKKTKYQQIEIEIWQRRQQALFAWRFTVQRVSKNDWR